MIMDALRMSAANPLSEFIKRLLITDSGQSSGKCRAAPTRACHRPGAGRSRQLSSPLRTHAGQQAPACIGSAGGLASRFFRTRQKAPQAAYLARTTVPAP